MDGLEEENLGDEFVCDEDTAKAAAQAILDSEFEQLPDDHIKEGWLLLRQANRTAQKEMVERGLLVKKGVNYQFPRSQSKHSSSQLKRKRNNIRKKVDSAMQTAVQTLGGLTYGYCIVYADEVTEGRPAECNGQPMGLIRIEMTNGMAHNNCTHARRQQ